jgi:hypothetical protein
LLSSMELLTQNLEPADFTKAVITTLLLSVFGMVTSILIFNKKNL